MGTIWDFKLSNLYIAQTKADFIAHRSHRSVKMAIDDANICMLIAEIHLQCDRDLIYL
jgi:hypothetical protein